MRAIEALMRLLVLGALTFVVPAAVPRSPTELQPFLAADGRIVSVQFHNRGGDDFAIDASSILLRLSSLDGPKRVVRIAPSAFGMQASAIVPGGGSGVTLSFAVAPGTESGMYDVAFEDANDAGLSFAEADIPAIYLSSAGEPGDPELAAARRDLIGASVYVGGMPTRFECTAQRASWVGIDTATKLDARSVRRIATAESGYYVNKADPDFLALEPLEIEFAPAPNRFVSASGGSTTPLELPLSSCGTYRITMAGPWEVRRRFFRRSPEDKPEWPAAFRDAIERGKVIEGMTHEMVAYALGYPSAYGSIDALDRLARWDYDPSGPFSSTVYFQDDRVVRYDPPGDLP